MCIWKIYLIYTDESIDTNNNPGNIEKRNNIEKNGVYVVLVCEVYEVPKANKENGTDKIEKLYCIIETVVSTVHCIIEKPLLAVKTYNSKCGKKKDTGSK